MAICGYFYPNRTTRSHYDSIGFYLFSRLLVKMVSHQTAQFLKVLFESFCSALGQKYGFTNYRCVRIMK